MKKAVLTFIAILILSMALMACGKSAGSANAQVPGASEAVAAAATP